MGCEARPDKPFDRSCYFMSVSRKAGRWITVGVIVLLLITTVAAISIVRGWSSFVSYGIGLDLSDYYVMINSSDLEIGPKQELLVKVGSIRDIARKRSMSFFKWLSYDESIRSMITDRKISAWEREALKREFERMEREFE